MKIEINDPALPKGTELSVYRLGILKNGEAVEFTDEEIALFEQEQGRSVQEAFSANAHVKVGGKITKVEEEPEIIAGLPTEEVEANDDTKGVN